MRAYFIRTYTISDTIIFRCIAHEVLLPRPLVQCLKRNKLGLAQWNNAFLYATDFQSGGTEGHLPTSHCQTEFRRTFNLPILGHLK